MCALTAPGILLPAACSRGATRASGPVVRFDVPSDPANLDPLFARPDAGGVDQQLARLAFEPFLDIDARGRMIPALVRAIPTVANGGISRDGRTLVYHLRAGLRWSDGVPLTSSDVLFTLHAIEDARNPVTSREGYDLIDRASAPDARTVRFHLRRAWAPAVATLFSSGTAPQYVLPAHVLRGERNLADASFGAAPSVGDGPFVFESWRRGERLQYRANVRYRRGPPHVARIEIGIVPDPQTNLTLVQSGAIDFNLVAPIQAVALQRAHAPVGFAVTPTAIVAGLALNVARPPLDDPRLRAAIAMSIDRSGLSAKVTFGRYPVADSDRPRFSWAYDASVREPAYDPAAADRLLDAAGWRRGPNGIRRKGARRLALTYVQFPETTTGVRVATLAERELRERGIDVTIKSISNAQLFLPQTGTLARGAFDLAYVPWVMGADPDDRFLLGCGGASNYMRYCNSRVDHLEADAASVSGRVRRRSDYRDIDRTVARDVPVVYLFNPDYVYAVAPSLRGFAPNAFVPTWNAYTWSKR